MWTRESLTAHLAAGNAVEFLFFWGHTPKRADAVDASCLSQWFPREFEEGGVRYASAEHFMMAAKAELFGDEVTLSKILAAPTPKEAKALGREVRGYDDAAWAKVRREAVVRGNLAKFGSHEDLRALLRSTRDRMLVEASPEDRIWGIGLAASNPDARNPSKWRGENLLGFALMQVRDALARQGLAGSGPA